MNDTDQDFESPTPSASIGDEPDLEAAEERARQAFGLASSPEHIEHRNSAQLTRSQLAARSSEDHSRTRFVRDGDVPVVYLPSSTSSPSSLPQEANRLVEAEAALETERRARLRAEHALSVAQSALREAQTRLGHASLAHTESDDAFQKLKAENSRLKARLA